MLAFVGLQGQEKKEHKTPEQKARNKTTEMVTAFKLTKEQDAMLYSTHLKYYQNINALEAKDPKKKEKKKKKDQFQAQRDKDYKRILTPAQYKLYTAAEKAEDLAKEKEKQAKKIERAKQAAEDAKKKK